MGRMFDAFQQGRSRRGPGEPAAASLHTIWPEDEAGPTDAPEEEMPFIEVGGPRSPAAATPVLPPFVSLPKPTVEPVVLPKPPPAAQLMTVRFRPLPVEGPTLRPLTRLAPELVAFHQPEHAISAQYRELASTLLAQTPSQQPRVLLFTSKGAGAGTTTVLLNTAITLAKQNLRRVVVVDAHLRGGKVADRLGLQTGPGLREVLAGRLPAEEAVQLTALPGLVALAAGELEGVAMARLAGESMRGVLWHLREQHDLVLVDAPCWDGRPELVALGCACDAVYLCLPEAEQDRQETTELIQVIVEQGAALRGCILTSR